MYEGTMVRLRSYKKEDIKDALSYVNDEEIRRNTSPGIPFPFTLEDEEKWYEANTALKDTYNLL